MSTLAGRRAQEPGPALRRARTPSWPTRSPRHIGVTVTPTTRPRVRQRRAVHPAERVGARHRRVRHPVPHHADQRVADGEPDPRRRAQARVGQADHRRRAVLPLRPAGQEAPRPRADLGPPDRRPVQDRRRRPADGRRPAHRADPGLLRRPGRPPVRACRCWPSYVREQVRRPRTSSSSPRTPAACAWPSSGPTSSAGCDIAFVHKTRNIDAANEVVANRVVGDVAGRVLPADRRHDRHRPARSPRPPTCCSTSGATDVVVAATHGIFSGPATDRLKNSRISEVDRHQHAADRARSSSSTSSPCSRSPRCSAQAIKEVFEDGSVTSLFAGRS